MSNPSSYVLITPARNEAEFIDLTLKSVVAQTCRPLRWVIVSDGSTDGTDEIVERHAAEHPWIRLVRMPERRERHFAGKVHAFNAGRDAAADLAYDAIGNLDADVSFGPEHFGPLVERLAEDPKLGLVGAPFREGNAQYDYRFTNIENVWGGCQLFRRECFEQIGGYIPVRGGGIDHLAVISARMKGWKTRTFTHSVCLHHRKMGTAQTSVLGARFKYGMKDYVLGNHPLWEVFRATYQMTQSPVFLGGLVLGSGYLWAALRQTEKAPTKEMVAFIRAEQMERLKKRFLGPKTHAATCA